MFCLDVGYIRAVGVVVSGWSGQRHQWLGDEATTSRRCRISLHTPRLIRTSTSCC